MGKSPPRGPVAASLQLTAGFGLGGVFAVGLVWAPLETGAGTTNKKSSPMRLPMDGSRIFNRRFSKRRPSPPNRLLVLGIPQMSQRIPVFRCSKAMWVAGPARLAVLLPLPRAHASGAWLPSPSSPSEYRLVPRVCRPNALVAPENSVTVCRF